MKIGFKSGRGITSQINGLKCYLFNSPAPREAKCCASFLDPVLNPQDVSENLKIRKLMTIRNCHAILNSLKRLFCIICHRETPGFDKPFSDIRVLEQGEKISFIDGTTEKHLKKSKVLGVSVQLDFSFNDANQCHIEENFIKGVCIECSKYFHIDENNDIKQNHNYAEYVKRCRLDQEPEQSSNDGFDISRIAPYSNKF